MYDQIRVSTDDEDERRKLKNLVYRLHLFVRLYQLGAPDIALKTEVALIYEALSAFPEYHFDALKYWEKLQIETRETEMQKWEYLYVGWFETREGALLFTMNGKPMYTIEKKDGISITLDELGSEGWELVGVSPQGSKGEIYPDSVSGDFQSTLYFKRPQRIRRD